MMLITPYDYLTTQHAWGAISNRGSNIYGPCPIHHGDNPNFVIYTHDQHWHCYMSGCAKHGDIVRLVKEMEFPELDERQWAPVYRRVEELSGMPLPARHHSMQRREVKPTATREQRCIMTAAQSWWHTLLSHMAGEEAGRSYLVDQGIETIPWSLGYAPRMNTLLFSSFDAAISEGIGTHNWHDLGVETGILREDGTVRMQERAIFACTNDEGEVVFYQGRTIHDGEPLSGKRRRAKYLGPPHLRKEPFFIPITHPVIQGFCLVESPKGPAAFAPDHIPCMATLGSGVDTRMLMAGVKCFGQPIYILTDNDPSEIKPETGEVTPGPGEKLAERVIALCTEQRYEWYRILPPRVHKDPDTWRRQEGVEPLLKEIERVREKG